MEHLEARAGAPLEGNKLLLDEKCLETQNAAIEHTRGITRGHSLAETDGAVSKMDGRCD